jgi:alkylation response protein AidB-like acyl-CoA dehydrogenase
MAPSRVRRLGPGPGRSLGDHGGDQLLRRQCGRAARPDVQHEHAAAARVEEQKQKYLPDIASGKLRLQSMAVTEPTTGTDTTQLKTTAVKKGDRYVVNGQKVWISRIQHSDLMILLARTTPLADVKKKSEGMSVFIVDLHQAIGKGMTVRPIQNMVNHETNEVFFDNLEIPAENLIGEEGQGFKYILDGLNAERTLIAAECIGDAYWFVDKARRYASERVVFNRPIGQNQGVQFPIADAYIEAEAANLMRFKACALFDAGKPCGARPTWPSTWPPRPRGKRPTSACRRTAASASRTNTTSSASSARRACTRWRRSPPT